ncbi:MAG: hypothetical protein L3J43_09655 [Sulfurovum sp.]|nr:hypothetical protein [Sulfurovum sp.]
MIKNKHIKSIGLGLLALSILVGCNDAKENESTDTNAKKEIKIDKIASAENFKKVLNQYMLKECVLIKTKEFPVEIDRRKEVERYTSEYEVLEKLKFIKSVGINKKTGYTKYIITDEGKNHYKIINNPYKEEGFCVATQEVGEITNFTAAKDMMGQTVSKVKFTIKTTEEAFVKDINKSILVESMARGIFKYAKSDSKNLILTEMKGWMLLSEFRKNR